MEMVTKSLSVCMFTRVQDCLCSQLTCCTHSVIAFSRLPKLTDRCCWLFLYKPLQHALPTSSPVTMATVSLPSLSVTLIITVGITVMKIIVVALALVWIPLSYSPVLSLVLRWQDMWQTRPMEILKLLFRSNHKSLLAKATPIQRSS